MCLVPLAFLFTRRYLKHENESDHKCIAGGLAGCWIPLRACRPEWSSCGERTSSTRDRRRFDGQRLDAPERWPAHHRRTAQRQVIDRDVRSELGGRHGLTGRPSLWLASRFATSASNESSAGLTFSWLTRSFGTNLLCSPPNRFRGPLSRVCDVAFCPTSSGSPGLPCSRVKHSRFRFLSIRK